MLKSTALPLTPEYLLDIPTFTRRYFEKLFSRLKIPSIIVFDNWQDIPAQSMLHEIICEGLINIPYGITLIFASREEPPADMAHLLATHNIEFITWEQLRFTEEESKDMLQLHDESRISDKTAKQIYHITQGWAAGLILMLIRAKRENIEIQVPDQYSQNEIFAYFASEIFNKLDQSRENFLLKTAYISKITPKIAANFTENRLAKHILAELASKNYFTERRSNPSLAYQYHPLFREFLLERSKSKFTPDDIIQLKLKAAELLGASGQIEEAAEIYCDINVWEKLAQLILKRAPIMLSQGRNQTLERWINSIPEKICNKIPWLYYWMGASLSLIDPIGAIVYFEKAYTVFKREKNLDGIFLSISSIIDCYIHEHNNMPLLEPWIEELQNLLSKNPNFSSIEIEARATFSMFMCMLYYVTENTYNSPISEWVKRCERLMEHIIDINQLVTNSNFLIFYYCLNDNLSKAALLLEKIKHKSRNKNIPPFSIILSKLNEAMLYDFTGDFTTCQKIVEEGLELANYSGMHIFDLHLLFYGLNSSFGSLDVVSNTKYFEMIAPMLNKMKKGCWDGEYQYMLGWKTCQNNDIVKSIEHLKRALSVAYEQKETIGLNGCHLGLAHLFIESGKYRQAAFHLNEVKSVFEQIESNTFLYQWLLINAQLAFKKNNEKKGLLYLKKAISLSSEKGIVFILLFKHSILAKLFIKALEAGIETDHTQKIIRKLKLVPDTPPIDCEHWPWPYQIYTLGKFSVLKDGKPLQFSGKVQKRPLQMLKVLISFGGSNINEEVISDILWPDAEGDMAHSSFGSTLHRLRRLFGNEKAFLLRDGKLSIDPRYCWVDITAFEHILKQADIADTEGNKGRAISLIKKALALYNGYFMANDKGLSFTILARDRLRSMYIRYIEKLGYLLEEAGKIKSAIECYQKGIEADNLIEEFYLKLMLCLKSLGRKAEAIAVYQRCKKNLAAGLGTKPSSKTSSIYRSLLMN